MTVQPEEEEKERFVRDLFDRIARRYDLMNRIMTAGAWHVWLRAFGRHAVVRPGDLVLDVGCGTADLCLLMASRLGSGGRVTGVDISEEMLAVGRRKVAASPWADRIHLRTGNALDLPFADASFDLVTSGFMLRNVADLDRALREMNRVTRPGGRVALLELSHPTNRLIRGPFALYFQNVVPLLGRWAARRSRSDVAPYEWLPISWRAFPDAPGLAARLAAAGWAGVRCVPLTGGIACLHLAEKPEKPR